MISITHAKLKKLIHYDPNTGELKRLTSFRGPSVNSKQIGSVTNKGYLYIRLGSKDRVLAQVLIWFYMTGVWPDKLVDHKDKNKLNNRWDNLRLATNSESTANRGLNKKNKLGVPGVSYVPSLGKYRARIGKDYKAIWLGTFDTIEEASSAYQKAREELFGEFA